MAALQIPAMALAIAAPCPACESIDFIMSLYFQGAVPGVRAVQTERNSDMFLPRRLGRLQLDGPRGQFVGALKFQHLVRIEWSGTRVGGPAAPAGRPGRAHPRRASGARRPAPDGLLYILTDNPSGRRIRLLPDR